MTTNLEIRITIRTDGGYGLDRGYACDMPHDKFYGATFDTLRKAFLNCMHFVSICDYALVVETKDMTKAEINELSALVVSYIGLRGNGTQALQSWIDDQGRWNIYY